MQSKQIKKGMICTLIGVIMLLAGCTGQVGHHEDLTDMIHNPDAYDERTYYEVYGLLVSAGAGQVSVPGTSYDGDTVFLFKIYNVFNADMINNNTEFLWAYDWNHWRTVNNIYCAITGDLDYGAIIHSDEGRVGWMMDIRNVAGITETGYEYIPEFP